MACEHSTDAGDAQLKAPLRLVPLLLLYSLRLLVVPLDKPCSKLDDASICQTSSCTSADCRVSGAGLSSIPEFVSCPNFVVLFLRYRLRSSQCAADEQVFRSARRCSWTSSYSPDSMNTIFELAASTSCSRFRLTLSYATSDLPLASHDQALVLCHFMAPILTSLCIADPPLAKSSRRKSASPPCAAVLTSHFVDVPEPLSAMPRQLALDCDDPALLASSTALSACLQVGSTTKRRPRAAWRAGVESWVRPRDAGSINCI